MSSGFVRLVNPDSRFTFSLNNLFHAFSIAISGYGFQYTMNESIRLERNTNILAIIASSTILITFLMDILLLDTPFTWTGLFGSIVVFGSVAFTVIYNNKR